MVKTEPEQIKKPGGQTNGIEMESDEDTEDENLPPVPSVQVLTNLGDSVKYEKLRIHKEKRLK